MTKCNEEDSATTILAKKQTRRRSFSRLWTMHPSFHPRMRFSSAIQHSSAPQRGLKRMPAAMYCEIDTGREAIAQTLAQFELSKGNSVRPIRDSAEFESLKDNSVCPNQASAEFKSQGQIYCLTGNGSLQC